VTPASATTRLFSKLSWRLRRSMFAEPTRAISPSTVIDFVCRSPIGYS
jgi:hypothetical protein